MPNPVLTEHEWHIAPSNSYVYDLNDARNRMPRVSAEAILNEHADTKQQLKDCAKIVLYKDKKIYKLQVALTLIGDVAYDRDGYTGDAEGLGTLVDDICNYARNPQAAVDALADTQGG